MKNDSFNRYLASTGISKVLILMIIVSGLMILLSGFVESKYPFWIAIVLISASILLWTTSLIAFKQTKK